MTDRVERVLPGRTGPSVNLAAQIERLRRFAAVVERDLSNARREAVNGRIRIIQRRVYVYRSIDPFAAAINPPAAADGRRCSLASRDARAMATTAGVRAHAQYPRRNAG